MAPAPYPDFRWFFRTVRVLPVVAIAALAGGAIGGFSIFAINLALTAPPNHAVPPEPGSELAGAAASNAAVPQPAPIRTFDAAGVTRPVHPLPAAPVNTASGSAAPAAPVPSASASSRLPAAGRSAPVPGETISPAQPMAAAMSAPPAGETDSAIVVVHPPGTSPADQVRPQTSPSPQIAVAPMQQKSWPDALSREHKTATNNDTAIAPQANNPPPTTERDRALPQSVKTETAPKPSATQSLQRRVAIKRPAISARASYPSSASRPLYDAYGRQDAQTDDLDSDRGVADDDNTRTKYTSTKSLTTKYSRTTKPRYDVRRQRPPVDVEQSSERADERLYDRSDDRDDDGDRGEVLPAQPAPPPLPFFGLFGGGDRD